MFGLVSVLDVASIKRLFTILFTFSWCFWLPIDVIYCQEINKYVIRWNGKYDAVIYLFVTIFTHILVAARMCVCARVLNLIRQKFVRSNRYVTFNSFLRSGTVFLDFSKPDMTQTILLIPAQVPLPNPFFCLSFLPTYIHKYAILLAWEEAFSCFEECAHVLTHARARSQGISPRVTLN